VQQNDVLCVICIFKYFFSGFDFHGLMTIWLVIVVVRLTEKFLFADSNCVHSVLICTGAWHYIRTFATVVKYCAVHVCICAGLL